MLSIFFIVRGLYCITGVDKALRTMVQGITGGRCFTSHGSLNTMPILTLLLAFPCLIIFYNLFDHQCFRLLVNRQTLKQRANRVITRWLNHFVCLFRHYKTVFSIQITDTEQNINCSTILHQISLHHLIVLILSNRGHWWASSSYTSRSWDMLRYCICCVSSYIQVFCFHNSPVFWSFHISAFLLSRFTAISWMLNVLSKSCVVYHKSGHDDTNPNLNLSLRVNCTRITDIMYFGLIVDTQLLASRETFFCVSPWH